MGVGDDAVKVQIRGGIESEKGTDDLYLYYA